MSTRLRSRNVYIRSVKSQDWMRTVRGGHATKSCIPLAIRGAGDENELSDLQIYC